MQCREAGRFVVNPYWIEYLMNLFFQEYYGEVWEEMINTKINNWRMIEGLSYGFIEREMLEDHIFKRGEKIV